MTARYLVLSDSHGARDVVGLILMAAEAGGRLDGVIHLGDGYHDLDPFEAALPPVIRVPGNCDPEFWNAPPDRMTFPAELHGARVLMTHGHRLGVKRDTDVLLARAALEKCRAALFGHTHSPLLRQDGDVLLLNPGAAMDHRYAFLNILDGGKITAELR